MEPISGVAVDVPENVERGESARLFPVLSESSREGRAASVFLATLSVVDALADALLRRIGRPVGKRARVRCFTEVVLKSDLRFRPDGLIVVDSGRNSWSALVECKIGKAHIEAEQLASYVRQARENGIDCVITISNELVADPRNPPTQIDGRLTRSVGYFHYSWLAIRSEAEIAYTQGLVTDPEKNFILAELIRFLSHPSTGIEGFTQMPAAWPDIVGEFNAGHPPSAHDARLLEIADAWLQEEKEIALILSRLVSRRCTSRSERKLRRDSTYDPVSETLDDLVDRQMLFGAFGVPDAASDIEVAVDLRSRLTRMSMMVKAPEDRKRPEARVNWFLAQLKAVDARGIDVVVHWPGRLKPTFAALADLREDPKLVTEPNRGYTPIAFEVSQCCHTPGTFVGRRRFIQDLETAIQGFYGDIGSRLTAWAPRPPATVERSAAERIESDAQIDPERLNSIERLLAQVVESLESSSEVPDPEPEAIDPEAEIADPVEEPEPTSEAEEADEARGTDEALEADEGQEVDEPQETDERQEADEARGTDEALEIDEPQEADELQEADERQEVDADEESTVPASPDEDDAPRKPADPPP